MMPSAFEDKMVDVDRVDAVFDGQDAFGVRGYSCIVMQCSNQRNLPFHIILTEHGPRWWS